MEFIAAPFLYDWPEIRPETNACWALIADTLRANGIAAPTKLTRSRPPERLWTDPGLLLGQTCGYPYVTRLRGRVRLVGTPRYDVEGCRGTDYSSFVVVHRRRAAVGLEGLRGSRVAVNDRQSQSGYSALRLLVAPLADNGRFFADTMVTGSHRASLHAVAGGTADLCAVDAVCWALAKRHDPELAGCLAVVAETKPAPGLPMICARSVTDPVLRHLRAALLETVESRLPGRTRRALCLGGFSVLPDSTYQRIADMERQAVALGYPILA
jgi:ABC-type phosphate/phosphonate transport system substrate-binding protein